MIDPLCLHRANLLARQIAQALDLPTHGMRITLVRPAALIHAVARRLSWYGIPSRIRPGLGPDMLRLDVGIAARPARSGTMRVA